MLGKSGLLLGALIAQFCILSACSVQPSKSLNELPEPVRSLNVFVATDLLAIPAAGVVPRAPNPVKVIPFDDKAEPNTQELANIFGIDMRENIEPMFREQGVVAFSYVAGAHYRWDELRKDQRNYSLIIWPTRSSDDSQNIDVLAVLRHEGTGRDVWHYSFKDPYHMRWGKPGGYTRAERLVIVQAMAKQLLSDLRKQNVLTNETPSR